MDPVGIPEEVEGENEIAMILWFSIPPMEKPVVCCAIPLFLGAC